MLLREHNNLTVWTREVVDCSSVSSKGVVHGQFLRGRDSDKCFFYYPAHIHMQNWGLGWDSNEILEVGAIWKTLESKGALVQKRLGNTGLESHLIGWVREK